jgi:hypothetical protein
MIQQIVVATAMNVRGFFFKHSRFFDSLRGIPAG